MFKKRQKNGGYSLHSVIVGVMIVGIMSTIAVTNLWPTAEKSKASVVASFIKEQQSYIISELQRGLGNLEDINNPGLGGDAKIQDYLGDLIDAGRLSEIPTEVFVDPTALTWEIRSMTQGGSIRAYYIHLTSANTSDQEMIDTAIDIVGIPPENFQ